MYINRTFVFGNLTRDPELRTMPNGGAVASFAIATNRTFKKSDGTRAEQTEFHNIVVFGKQAESCAQYLKKGNSAYVEGRLQTRSWDGEKGKQYRTEIVAERVQFGPRSPQKAGDDVDQRPASERATGAKPASNGEVGDDQIDYPEEEIDVDAIPF